MTADRVNPLPDTLTRRNTMPDVTTLQALPFVLVELLDDPDVDRLRIRSGNAVETADDQAALLAGALHAVLARGNVGPGWSGVAEAIRTMPEVDDDTPDRPMVTVLCGSTRFGQTFREQNLLLTLRGEIVLSIGCDTKSDDDLAAAFAAHGDDLKPRLDALHLRKIDLADRVLVLDVGGYIGESTRSEIAYAEQLGKPIAYLSRGA